MRDACGRGANYAYGHSSVALVKSTLQLVRKEAERYEMFFIEERSFFFFSVCVHVVYVGV